MERHRVDNAVPLYTGLLGSLSKVLDIWKERGTSVSGKGMAGGRTHQEDNPAQVLAEFQALFES